MKKIFLFLLLVIMTTLSTQIVTSPGNGLVMTPSGSLLANIPELPFNRRYITFNGSNYADVSSFVPANVLDNTAFSISFWRKGTGGYALGCKDSLADWFGIDLSVSTQVAFKFGNASDNVTITANTTEWENIILTYDKSSVIVYVNNVSKGSAAIGDISDSYSLSGMFIGGYNNNGIFADGFTGNIDEVIIFNKVLSSDERSTIIGSGTVQTVGDARVISGLKAYWRFEEVAGPNVIDWAG